MIAELACARCVPMRSSISSALLSSRSSCPTFHRGVEVPYDSPSRDPRTGVDPALGPSRDGDAGGDELDAEGLAPHQYGPVPRREGELGGEVVGLVADVATEVSEVEGVVAGIGLAGAGYDVELQVWAVLDVEVLES